MDHRVNVYYMYCPRELCPEENYHRYQQKLADRILNLGLRNMFRVDGTRKTVEKGRHGKPYLKGMEQYQYNISNTEGMVVCALSDVSVGVDVERKKPFRESILRKCASPLEKEYILSGADKAQQEERFFRLWTLKESYIKMTGEGMCLPLQEVNFEISETEQCGIRCSMGGCFYQKEKGEYWISLCAGKKAEVTWISLEEKEIIER